MGSDHREPGVGPACCGVFGWRMLFPTCSIRCMGGGAGLVLVLRCGAWPRPTRLSFPDRHGEDESHGDSHTSVIGNGSAVRLVNDTTGRGSARRCRSGRFRPSNIFPWAVPDPVWSRLMEKFTGRRGHFPTPTTLDSTGIDCPAPPPRTQSAMIRPGSDAGSWRMGGANRQSDQQNESDAIETGEGMGHFMRFRSIPCAPDVICEDSVTGGVSSHHSVIVSFSDVVCTGISTGSK